MMNWQNERTMSPEEYVWALKHLRLNKSAAGRYLGVSVRTSRRYVAGESLIPPAHVLLLRSLIAHKVRPVVPKRPKKLS